MHHPPLFIQPARCIRSRPGGWSGQLFLQWLAFVAAGVMAASQAYGQAGSVDNTFVPGVGFATNAVIQTVVLQPDGKLIVGGSFAGYGSVTSSNLIRINSNGTTDVTFRSGLGIRNTNSTLVGDVRGLALQPDGRIIVGGLFNTYGTNALRNLIRLAVDGTPDATYANNHSSSVDGVALLQNGNLLHADVRSSGPGGSSFQGVAGRLPDGSTNAAFDSSLDFGSSLTAGPGFAIPPSIRALVEQADGKILVAGRFTDVAGSSRTHLVRLNADGTLDPAFDAGAIQNGGSGHRLYGLLLQPDQKIIIFGQFDSVAGTARRNIARLNTDGTLDSSFDPGTGAVGSFNSGEILTAARQSDGRIIIGGRFTTFNGTPANRLARLNADGTLDSSFNIGTGPAGTANDVVQQVVLQPDGHVIVAGQFTTFAGLSRPGLVRLLGGGGGGGGGAPAGSVRPVAHWRFDEAPGATTAADSAGTFDGTLSATGASFVSGGRAGNALALDKAADGHVNMGNVLNLAASGTFSFVAWVKTNPGDTTDNLIVLSKVAAGVRNGYFMVVNTTVGLLTATKAHFVIGGTGTSPITSTETPSSTTVVNDGNWHQIVAVQEAGGTKRIYVDGAPAEDTKPTQAAIDGTGPFLVGGQLFSGSPSGWFNGSIDDIQVYDRALSDAEINFLFANPGLEIVPTTVTGTVRNAVNGQPLAGAAVSVNGGASVITSAAGTFTVTNVPSGTASIQATATGFFTYTNSFTLAPVPTNTIGFSLSPTISGSSTVRLVLNWGASPSDLDSHLETPVIGGQPHHVYFVNRGSTNFAPFAELDVDDVTGFGPETITISTLSPGTYHYYIHNFSGSPGFNVSGATAQIYTSAGLVATVAVPTTNSTGIYWYVARIDGSSGTITVVNSISDTVPVVVGAPAITSQPQTVVTNQGSTAVFSVTATGNAPLTYQWRFNGVNILGANNSVLALFNVQPANAGQYDCVVNNAVGSATSSLATLTVNAVLPVITSQPAGFRVLPGTNVSFSVAATGLGPFTYQWRFNGANIIGATNAVLALANVQPANSGAYSVAVINAFGTTLSTAGNLEVLTPPVISVHPLGRSVASGDTVNFSVVHSGSQPFTYQWLLNGLPVPAATNSSLNLFNVQFVQAGNYSVAISNDAGGVISSNALLQVASPPIITDPPVPRTALAGRPATFSAGVIGSPVLAYQWRVNGTNIPGANTSSFSLAAAQVSDRGLYSLVITNVYGSVTSAPAFLAVHPVAVLPGWVNQAGGAGADVGNACATDGAGNLYVAGYFTGTATFGTNALISAGLSDAFVAKYNSAGALLWVRRVGGPGFDTANGLAVDTLGNCYVTGAFEGAAGFGTNSLVNTDAASFTDIFVTKLDADGNFVWARGTGVKGVSDAGQAVTVDLSGNVLVAGRSGQTTFGGSPVAGAGRIFLAKYDNTGNALWARAVGLAGSGGALDGATGVGTDASGRIHLAGNFEGPQATFGTATLTNRGLSDGFLALFDANGVPQRVVQIGGAGQDKVNALAVDAAGNAHVAGHFSGSLTLGAVGSLIPADVGLTSSGQIDAFVAQFDSSGSLAWANRTGGSGPDSIRGLALGPNGTVHVTGYFSGTASFGSNTLVSSGATLDVFTARYTSTGQPSFAQQSGGSDLSGDYGNAIAVDAAGNSFVTGQFSGGATLGTGQTDSSGGGDVFLTRFNAPQESAPQVSFRISGGNLILTWPVAAHGWGLQDAPANPIPAGWRSAAHAITVVGEEYVVTIPLAGQKGFFRLVR